MKKILYVAAAVALIPPPLAGAGPVLFSVDPASPAVDGMITPDDILRRGPAVHTPGTDLGLQDSFFSGVFDNLDALSFGAEPIRDPLFFSVDRVAVGVPGSHVHSEAQPGAEEAAGDVFQALPPTASNVQVFDEQRLGLLPGFFGDDLDALSLLDGPFVYFSIDALSASISSTVRPGDIFLGSLGNKFADHQMHLGLDPDDDLDALILNDTFEPGVLNPGRDMALFSLSTFSPSTFTFAGTVYMPGVKGRLSPADILLTDFTGGFSLRHPAAALGLLPDDELDALATVAEPGSLALASIGVISVGIATWKRRRPERRL